jgi:hypothetical protein
MESLHWDEEKAIKYVLELFKDGTIRKITLFDNDGNEL